MTFTRRSLPLMLAMSMIPLPAVAHAQAQDGTAPAIEGDLSFSGPPEMAPLLKRWQEAFNRDHPRIRFVDQLVGRDTAIYGIEMRSTDIALLDRPINPFERYGTYEHSWIFPVEIEVATDGGTASVDPATEAVFVRKDSPIDRLTVAQLDGIFGAERDGGFDKLDWNEAAARDASANITTWGQLGVKGKLAKAAIHPYGPASHGNGVITYFQLKVLNGGAMRAEATREYADPTALFADLARDPQGIAYGPFAAMPPGFKAVALADAPGKPYVLPSRATLADRSYPLARPVYVYFTIDTPTGQLANPRVNPKIMAFMKYVLSPAGQAEVARDGRYLPLTPEQAARQLAELTSTKHPPERP